VVLAVELKLPDDFHVILCPHVDDPVDAGNPPPYGTLDPVNGESGIDDEDVGSDVQDLWRSTLVSAARTANKLVQVRPCR
jgi:hypothetical protein